MYVTSSVAVCVFCASFVVQSGTLVAKPLLTLRFIPNSGQLQASRNIAIGPFIMMLVFQLAYATAVGFTAAGFASTLYSLYSGRTASLTHPVETIADGLRIIVLSLIAGPWILASSTYSSRREGNLTSGFFGAGIFISWLWSLCFGIILITLIEYLQA